MFPSVVDQSQSRLVAQVYCCSNLWSIIFPGNSALLTRRRLDTKTRRHREELSKLKGNPFANSCLCDFVVNVSLLDEQLLLQESLKEIVG